MEEIKVINAPSEWDWNKALVNANKIITTIDLKGKKYAQVNQRVKAFRINFPNWRLITELIEASDDKVIFLARAINPQCEVIATGYAEEYRNSSMVNKTSAVENCETSAIGRCLGNLGIGIDEAYASAEELVNALKGQEKASLEQVEFLRKNLDKGTKDAIKKSSVKTIDKLTKSQAAQLISKIKDAEEDEEAEIKEIKIDG